MAETAGSRGGSRILITQNGRYGDLLWTLPVVRAISRRLGEPVDLIIPGEFHSILPLLGQQAYIRRAYSNADWSQGEREYPEGTTPGFLSQYQAVINLGYRGWPEPDCIRHTLETANQSLQQQLPAYAYREWKGRLDVLTWEELNLATPWITTDALTANAQDGSREDLIIGFSETYVELKMGVSFYLGNVLERYTRVLSTAGDRKDAWLGPCAVDYNLHRYESTWENAAWHIGTSRVFLGCCSGLHVLAVALGTPVVLMEPMEARHNPVFYPFGKTGPQVTLVTGNDGLPTFDARHVADALRPYLSLGDR